MAVQNFQAMSKIQVLRLYTLKKFKLCAEAYNLRCAIIYKLLATLE